MNGFSLRLPKMCDSFLGGPLPKAGAGRAGSSLHSLHGGLDLLPEVLVAALAEMDLASVSAVANMGSSPGDCLEQIKQLASVFRDEAMAGPAVDRLLARWDVEEASMLAAVRRLIRVSGALTSLQVKAVMLAPVSEMPPPKPPPRDRGAPADPRRPWKRTRVLSIKEEVKTDKHRPPVSMLDREVAARKIAAGKLRNILARAGSAAGLLPKLAELGEEAAEELLAVVLASGAFKTISAHVRNWHHLEWFFERQQAKGALLESWTLYPPSWALVVAYMTERVKGGCGPTVPDAIGSSVKWICSKLVMDVPALDDACVVALKKEAIARVSATLKEAQPFPVYVIKFLEKVARTSPYHQGYRLIAGFTLCLIYASLRFNDALHIKVSSLQMSAGALRGICWQTKSERKRRGTPFAVPDVSVSASPWLLDWYEWHSQFLHPAADFWIPRFDVDGKPDFHKPGEFKGALALLRELLKVGDIESLDPTSLGSPWELEEPPFNPDKYTWHSARCTVMTWAGEQGKPLQSMLVQMHSHDPRCGEKYMRNRLGVACQMVTELVADLQELPPAEPSRDHEEAREREAVAAEEELSSSSSSSDSGDLSEREVEEEGPPLPLAFYIVQKACEDKPQEYKFHAPSLLYPGDLACGVGKITDQAFKHAGARPWPKGLVCRRCIAARPDVRKLVADIEKEV